MISNIKHSALLCLFIFLPLTATAQEKLFYLSSGNSGIESLKKNLDKIDIVAPQAYKISAELIPYGSVSNEVRTIAKTAGIKMMPLIVNDGFRQDIIHNLLSSTTAQDRLIRYMVSEAQLNNYVGWQFDLEHIFYKDRALFTAFVEKASQTFHSKGLELSIAAVARVSDTENDYYKNWSGAFDYEKLSESLDFISIMAYDDPNSNGPSASMPYVKNVYAYLKNKVPPEKLSWGIPLYYWGWSIYPAKKLRTGSYTRIQWLKSIYSYLEGFNDTYKVPYLIYYDQGQGYIIWHEDERSFKEKLDFAKANNLRGFSAWVLGVEDPKIWNVL